MPSLPQATLDLSDVLGLLESEERAELEERLRAGIKAGAEPFADLSVGQLLGEIVKLRLPFVRMMSDVCALLGRLEATIRGNVRFVVLPDLSADLSLDF